MVRTRSAEARGQAKVGQAARDKRKRREPACKLEQVSQASSSSSRWKPVRLASGANRAILAQIICVALALLVLVAATALEQPSRVDGGQVSAFQFEIPNVNPQMLASKLSPFHDIAPDAFIDPVSGN